MNFGFVNFSNNLIHHVVKKTSKAFSVLCQLLFLLKIPKLEITSRSIDNLFGLK